MNYRTALAVAALAAAIAPLCAHAQKKPRTAWGDPDLTGAYSEFTTAPLERDAKLGDKEFFTPAEHAEFAENHWILASAVSAASAVKVFLHRLFGRTARRQSRALPPQ